MLLLSMLPLIMQANSNITACQVFAEHLVGDQHKNVSVNQLCHFSFGPNCMDVTVLEENEANFRIKVQLTEGNKVYPADEVSGTYGEPVAMTIGTSLGNNFVIGLDKQ